jgi:hypothetical protein
MPSARGVRGAAILGAAGLAGVYAFEAAQYHRSGAKGFDLENPPSPGTPDFASTRSRGRGGDPGQPAQRGCRTRSGLLLMRVLVKRTGPDQVTQRRIHAPCDALLRERSWQRVTSHGVV